MRTADGVEHMHLVVGRIRSFKLKVSLVSCHSPPTADAEAFPFRRQIPVSPRWAFAFSVSLAATAVGPYRLTSTVEPFLAMV